MKDERNVRVYALWYGDILIRDDGAEVVTKIDSTPDGRVAIYLGRRRKPLIFDAHDKVRVDAYQHDAINRMLRPMIHGGTGYRTAETKRPRKPGKLDRALAKRLPPRNPSP